jgi:hypothetical protein
MIRLPTSRSKALSSRSKIIVVVGVGSSWRNCSMSRTPRASEPDSCLTRGSNVVVNSTFVGVGWIIEGLLVGEMMGIERFHHFTKGAPCKQLHSLRRSIRHPWRYQFSQPYSVVGNSAITPLERNPENTPGACQSPSPATAACLQRWWHPQHPAAARRSASQHGVARVCVVWTSGAGWARLKMQWFPGARPSQRPGLEKLRGGQTCLERIEHSNLGGARPVLACREVQD